MKFLVFALSLLLITVSCSGGGSRYPKGKVCASSYDPIPVDVANKQKLSLDPSQMPAGVFSYEGAEVYYQGADGVKIHRAEGINRKNGELVSSIKCMAGLKPDLVLPQESIASIKSMKIETSGKVNEGMTRVATIGFNKGYPAEPLFTDGAGFDLPSKVFDGAVSEGPAFYKMDENNDASYQIRSKRVFADGSYLAIVVFLKRAE